MKIKVCGIKYPENCEAVQALQPDFLGFIFYEKSPRFVADDTVLLETTKSNSIETVGVFVNSSVVSIINKVNAYSLDFVQLHGDESIDAILALKEQQVKIIKAFPIKEDVNWKKIHHYAKYVDYFLFDTASKNYGGSGQQFNWEILKNYREEVPFFLSGGIGIEDLSFIQQLEFRQLYGIDVNSKFEIEPGLKNIEELKIMINQVKNESTIHNK